VGSLSWECVVHSRLRRSRRGVVILGPVGVGEVGPVQLRVGAASRTSLVFRIVGIPASSTTATVRRPRELAENPSLYPHNVGRHRSAVAQRASTELAFRLLFSCGGAWIGAMGAKGNRFWLAFAVAALLRRRPTATGGRVGGGGCCCWGLRFYGFLLGRSWSCGALKLTSFFHPRRGGFTLIHGIRRLRCRRCLQSAAPAALWPCSFGPRWNQLQASPESA